MCLLYCLMTDFWFKCVVDTGRVPPHIRLISFLLTASKFLFKQLPIIDWVVVAEAVNATVCTLGQKLP